MKRKTNTIAKVFLVLIMVIFVFGAMCVYGALDYVRRCVDVDPRDVSSIEIGRLYSVHDIYEIKTAKDNAHYDLYIYGDDVTYETFDGEKSFKITGGTGTVHISLSVLNDDSPEANACHIDVPLVNKQ